MVIMEKYNPTLRENLLQELWEKINQFHLSYLQMEESPDKLQHRNHLEEYIREFLYLTSHNQKFYFTATAEVLNRSASSRKDFSGYRASTGWNAIQMYAGNLLAQPWRKEYREIKTYSGFYKHQIEANLVGAELMFEAMGYKQNGSGVLLLEGPVSTDLVESVSRDCLIAYVECQIIKQIWEEISPASTITWFEVLDARKNNICTLEQCIKLLTYHLYSKQCQAQGGYAQRASAPPPVLPYSAPFYCCSNNYATYAPMPHYYHTGAPPPPQNGYFPAPVYDYAIPTGQLIELSGHSNGNAHSTDEVDAKSDRAKSRREKENDSQLEEWDYVYRNLESQGYSKDLGERGDLLKKPKQTNLDETLRRLKVADRERKRSEGSSYDNVGEKKAMAPNATLKSKVSSSRTVNGVAKLAGVRWECGFCTYINRKQGDICEMCSKSRGGKVEQRMEIGGPECSKCTLVNPKETKKCTACGEDLENSPTYI